MTGGHKKLAVYDTIFQPTLMYGVETLRNIGKQIRDLSR